MFRIPKDRRQILEIGDEKMKLKEMRKVSTLFLLGHTPNLFTKVIEEMMGGEDLSDLFPTVVKNVACKSVEVGFHYSTLLDLNFNFIS